MGMTEEQTKERVIDILRKIHELRFDIELLAIIDEDPKLFAAAQSLTDMLPIVGNKATW